MFFSPKELFTSIGWSDFFQQPFEVSWVDKYIINFILNMETGGGKVITYPKMSSGWAGDNNS